MKRMRWMIPVAALLTLPALAAMRDEVPPKLSVVPAKTAVARGETVKGVLKIQFAEGLHGYQNPPTEEYQIPVTISTKTPGVKLKVTYPKGAVRESMGVPTALYEGYVDFPFQLTIDRPRGRVPVTFDVRYQQCTETNCFPPQTRSVQTVFTVR
ncbi:MAG: protein-disulfide reductase DsbD domain-containing protein [Fimbriimonadaceae bacterium]